MTAGHDPRPDRRRRDPLNARESIAARLDPDSGWRLVDPDRPLHEQVTDSTGKSDGSCHQAAARSPRSFTWLTDSPTEPAARSNPVAEADGALDATLRAARANVHDRLGTPGTVNADALVFVDPRHRDRIRSIPSVDPQPLLRQVLPAESSHPSDDGQPLSPPLQVGRVIGVYLLFPVGLLLAAIALVVLLIGA